MLSDSKSVIRKVQTGLLGNQWLESAQRSTILNVNFAFVPDHSEFAAMKDRTVVGIATISGGQPLDHTDVSNDPKDVGKMEAVNRHRDPRDVGRMEGFGGSESSSTSRLHELK